MGSAPSLSSNQGSGHRVALMDKLYLRYGRLRAGLVAWCAVCVSGGKSMPWILVVGGAKVLKRAIDVMAATVLLAGLSPLFLVVMILIKLTDRGSVLFWQTAWDARGASLYFLNFVPWGGQCRASERRAPGPV